MKGKWNWVPSLASGTMLVIFVLLLFAIFVLPHLLTVLGSVGR